MKFCSHCAAPVKDTIPAGDDRLRKTCTACGAIHYDNPVPVVGCVVESEGRVLLCRRAIEPGRGRWTLPAGYLELGEGARDGARRETREEAGADVEIIAPHSQIDVPNIGQTYSVFRARLRAPEVAAGTESLEVAFVEHAEIPWDEIAFPVIHFALRLFVEDRQRERYHLHLGTLRWREEGSRFDASCYDLVDHLKVGLDG